MLVTSLTNETVVLNPCCWLVGCNVFTPDQPVHGGGSAPGGAMIAAVLGELLKQPLIVVVIEVGPWQARRNRRYRRV